MKEKINNVIIRLKKLQQPSNHEGTINNIEKLDTHLPSLLISKNEVYPVM